MKSIYDELLKVYGDQAENNNATEETVNTAMDNDLISTEQTRVEGAEVSASGINTANGADSGIGADGGCSAACGVGM